jgi:hypothetical protein
MPTYLNTESIPLLPERSYETYAKKLVVRNFLYTVIFFTRSSGKFPGFRSAKLRFQLRYNFVKPETWYLNFGVFILKRSWVSVYASVLLKKLQSFEILLLCFETAYLRHTFQKTTELRYVLRINSPRPHKNLRFQKHNWNSRFICRTSIIFHFFIPRLRKMIRTSWKRTKMVWKFQLFRYRKPEVYI